MTLAETQIFDTSNQLLASPDTEGDIRTGGMDTTPAMAGPSDFQVCMRPTPDEMFYGRNATDSIKVTIRAFEPEDMVYDGEVLFIPLAKEKPIVLKQ